MVETSREGPEHVPLLVNCQAQRTEFAWQSIHVVALGCKANTGARPEVVVVKNKVRLKTLFEYKKTDSGKQAILQRSMIINSPT